MYMYVYGMCACCVFAHPSFRSPLSLALKSRSLRDGGNPHKSQKHIPSCSSSNCWRSPSGKAAGFSVFKKRSASLLRINEHVASSTLKFKTDAKHSIQKGLLSTSKATLGKDLPCSSLFWPMKQQELAFCQVLHLRLQWQRGLATCSHLAKQPCEP